ncbi:MAG: class I SAM-dependent methyltransferase [Rhodobiaceae bacterium]|nr:class I SAM-dependent methyltransferase [Rhodobiaceae bacterium]MCC0041838.1 class I SAM-dependent methyltransferase [Rhodobiaceae bacterium]
MPDAHGYHPNRHRPSLARTLMRGAYAARQVARFGWFTGQRLTIQRMAGRDDTRATDAGGVDASRPAGRPAGADLVAGIRDLFARDLANAESGYYPLPRDADGTPMQMLARARAMFADLPTSNRRRLEDDGQEVFRELRAQGEASGLPRYYLQNFHFQTDGYLSDGSARLYDTQVEVLFNGTANAMRRQALVPVAQFIEGRDQRKLQLTDVACGTGRYLRMLREAFPRLRLTGIDLSESYLREARRHIGSRYPVRLVMGNAEALPLPDESQDIVTSVFLYHELPAKVRRVVAGEFARVLRPGGILVFTDSLQIGDVDGYDKVLESFPGRFHEPYYDGYIRDDLDTLFGAAGLQPVSHAPAFLSKVSVYCKGQPVGA